MSALLSSALDLEDRPYSYWERTTHALLVLLVSKKVLTVDQLRRSVEGLHPTHYASFSYYEKWAAAMTHQALEGKTLSEGDVASALGSGPHKGGASIVLQREFLAIECVRKSTTLSRT